MTRLNKVLVPAAIGAGILAFSTLGASAAIVCANDVCWHTHETYTYPPSAGVIIHEDTWRPARKEKFVFREHPGRGYWRGDNWVEF